MRQSSFEAMLLGMAQDGGAPHAGCGCATCAAAWRDPAMRQLVACLGLLDHQGRRCWLIDATPDFPEQLHRLQEVGVEYALSGIFLTHAHIGHYTGLIHLGREVMNTRGMPVYCTERMAAFLRTNAPWAALVADGNIELRLVTPGRPLALTPQVQITAMVVPHRGEFSDTVAYGVKGPRRRQFYCPDVDGWEGVDLTWVGRDSGVALVDGTFFHADELPGRDLAAIPHPLVEQTVQQWGARGQDDPAPAVYFIHLNHTNPLWHEGPERAWLEARGYAVGRVGMRWPLA